MEDKIIDEYYISKAKEIIIRFIDDTECTISDIRALDLDLNSDDISTIDIEAYSFNPILRDYFNKSILIKQIIVFYNYLTKDDLINSGFDFKKKEKLMALNYNVKATINNFRIRYVYNDQTCVYITLKGNFYA